MCTSDFLNRNKLNNNLSTFGHDDYQIWLCADMQCTIWALKQNQLLKNPQNNPIQSNENTAEMLQQTFSFTGRQIHLTSRCKV